MTHARHAVMWLRAQPDRPFVIVFAHISVVVLYLTGNAVSTLPFHDPRAKTLIESPIMPTFHALAALLLIAAIFLLPAWRGSAAGVSVAVWAGTTASLFFASYQRIPPGAYWGAALSLVITVAAFLMFVRWGVDGDGDQRGGG